MLEELVGRRADEREEAMFNLGFEHGLACGRADALAARHPARDALRDQITRLVVRAGLEGPRALAALLEVAWALSLGPRRPHGRKRE